MNIVRIKHPFPPICDRNSRLLILGTLPSVKSRENAFYYGHPQNRFWRVIAALFHEPVPDTNADKTSLLLRNRIALWDVVQSCDISGSSDSSIRNVVPNDLSLILHETGLKRIYANGSTAAALYRKYQQTKTGIEIIPLPSTSPANAAWSLERLCAAWSVITEE